MAKYVENGETEKEFYVSKDKKNVFLIGDSIREGYCANVKKYLKDKAEVFYINDNCRSTQYVIFSLKGWWNMFDNADKIDVVHFNCGHWDVARFSGCELPLTSEDEYAKNLHLIAFLLRRFFKNAKIIFATTTPMNPDGGSVGGSNPRSTATISRYNEIAVKAMKEESIPVNDLFAFTRNFDSGCYQDACHFTQEASAMIAKQVSKRIEELL